ncbi:uncharacterized protein LOC142557285 isoform X2 [Dermacentor variabilis]|uniref:uncharacterized protein LOC142557285 isoform X2 n=1 Tax=Dermacentor variabilis TaxID=34621 RepID=UPI003F5B919C
MYPSAPFHLNPTNKNGGGVGYKKSCERTMMQVENALTWKRPREKNLLKCQQCNYTTRQRGHMNRHMVVHTGKRPFGCHLCPMAFSRQASLADHVQTHSRSNKFQCRYCPVTFTDRSALWRHFTVMHFTP